MSPTERRESVPLEARVVRPELAALTQEIQAVAEGDTAVAGYLRSVWRIEANHLRLGIQDPIDEMVAGCDLLADQWAADPSVTHREWFLDALLLTQSVLIEAQEQPSRDRTTHE